VFSQVLEQDAGISKHIVWFCLGKVNHSEIFNDFTDYVGDLIDYTLG